MISGWRGVSVVYDRCVELGREIKRLVEPMEVDDFQIPSTTRPPAHLGKWLPRTFSLWLLWTTG